MFTRKVVVYNVGEQIVRFHAVVKSKRHKMVWAFDYDWSVGQTTVHADRTSHVPSQYGTDCDILGGQCMADGSYHGSLEVNPVTGFPTEESWNELETLFAHHFKVCGLPPF